MSPGVPLRVRLDPAAPDPDVLMDAARRLAAGEVVAFPTDTVYGLAADPLRPEALDRIFELKARPREKSLVLLLAAAADVAPWAELPPEAIALVAHLWPGPLTLVLRAAAPLPPALLGPGGTLALRVPDHPVARALARALGRPLATTSANRAGQPAPSDAPGVVAELGDQLSLLDAGPCPGGQASTVLTLAERPPRVLRAGPLRAEALRAWLPDLVAPADG